jgi:hypothetical protein
MTAPTEAAHPTVDNSRRKIRVTAVITWSPVPTMLRFAENVIQDIWEHDIAVFGYRVDLIDQDELGPEDDEVAILDVDALSPALASVDGPWPDADEVWGRLDISLRTWTGDGWRVDRVEYR